ncbi:cobyrinic acid a,c-diamide synthase [Pseudomonas rhodesiae]|nr:cobyrinic acid a,c-diamide synthase [Pseudomonas rhodesiae]
MNQPRHCPAVLIAAPASGQGKTTVTAALARLHRNLGRKVRVFKCGPDFLDPMIHERASGAPVYQLDMWMVGEQESRRLLWEAAGEADLILIEGVMGLFDGTPSSADLARHFGVPVLGVIDGTAMAQTFGALALGLARYQPDLPFAGVLANRVGTLRHAQLLEGSLTEGLRWYGALSRETGIELPSRHLGLVQASELNDLDLRLDAAAQALGSSCEVAVPPPVTFAAPTIVEAEPLLAGVRIAVARDEAFAFTYGASLDLLRAMGAELHFFSPIHDRALPDADSLYLPGGYPELHHQALAQNTPMLAAIRAHPRGRQTVARRVRRHVVSAGLAHRCRRQSSRTGRPAAGRCRHAEKTRRPGPAKRRIARRRTAWPYLPSFPDQHGVAADCPWPKPEWWARCRGSLPTGADDCLLRTLLFPVESDGGRRLVCPGPG